MARIDAAKIASALILSCTAPVFAPQAAAAPIEPGASQQSADIGGKSIPIFLYRPACAEPSLLLVFHGVDRKPDRYRDHARPLADQLCMVVVAPLFDKKMFQRYQYGGLNKKGAEGKWTGKIVLDLVEWARKQEGKRLPYSLLGHSAGGQFLSRIAAYTPTEARRIVVANPSSHVLAKIDVRAPYGLGGFYQAEKAEAALKRYLEAPVTIFLGQNDVGDKNLSEAPEAKAQGDTRYARGLNAFHVAKTQANKSGLIFNWRLVELPGVGHNAAKMFSSPQARDALAP